MKKKRANRINTLLTVLLAGVLFALAACSGGSDTSEADEMSGVSDISSEPSAVSEPPEADDSSAAAAESNEESSEEPPEVSAEESGEESSEEPVKVIVDNGEYNGKINYKTPAFDQMIASAEKITVDGANFDIREGHGALTLYAMTDKDGKRLRNFVYTRYDTSLKDRVLMEMTYKASGSDRTYCVVEAYDYNAKKIFTFKCARWYASGGFVVAEHAGGNVDVYDADGRQLIGHYYDENGNEVMGGKYSAFCFNALGIIGISDADGICSLYDYYGTAYDLPKAFDVACFDMGEVYVMVFYGNNYSLKGSVAVSKDENGGLVFDEYDLADAIKKHEQKLAKTFDGFLKALYSDNYGAMKAYATQKLIDEYELYKSGEESSETGSAVACLREQIPDLSIIHIYPRDINGLIYAKNEAEGRFLYGFKTTLDYDAHPEVYPAYLTTVSDGKGGLLIDSIAISIRGSYYFGWIE